jgi:pre-mRNA-splicing factor CWC22
VSLIVCVFTCSNAFEDAFVGTLKLCHKLETNKLRNIGKLFAHLFGTDAISWAPLSEVVITEERTTSASRIFVKFLFQARCLLASA